MESYRLTRRNTIVTGVGQLQAARGRVAPRTPDQGSSARSAVRSAAGFPPCATCRSTGPGAAGSRWRPRGCRSWVRCTRGSLTSWRATAMGLPKRRTSARSLADRLLGERSHEDLAAVWRERPRFTPALMFNGPV